MAEPSGNTVLLFDTILNGHHSDYLTYLVEYWFEQQIPGELFVVTPPGFSATLPAQWATASSIRFLEIPDQELHAAQHASRLTRAFAEWNLYVKYAEQIQPTHALLLYFDLFQPGVWLGKASPCPFSGILFRPSFHYTNANTTKEKIVELRKKWLLGRVLKNKKLATLFCLDKSSVPGLKSMTDRVRILPLSDPVKQYQVSQEKVMALRKSLGLSGNQKIFLIFGFLDGRKGVLQALEAIQQLDPTEQAQLKLVLAGQISDEYRETIQAHLKALGVADQVCCQFNKIRSYEIPVYFHLSDFILTLYQKHVGMSSVIARAALANKPLISTDYGYMGYLVDSSKLGISIDSESVEAIKLALRKALKGEVTVALEDTQRFTNQNSFESFSQQIFETILKNESRTIQ